MATLTGTYVTVNIPGGSSLEVDTGYVGEIFQLVKTDNSCYTFVVQEGTVTLTPNGYNSNCTPEWRRLWNLNG